MLDHPEFAKLVEDAFDTAVVRPVVAEFEKANQIVKREQDKLNLMSILAKKPVENV